MINKRKHDLIGYLVLVFIAVALWILVPYQIEEVELTKPGYALKVTSQSFPRLAIGIFFISSIVESMTLLYRIIKNKVLPIAKAKPSRCTPKHNKNYNPLIVIVSLLAFVVLLPKIGFLVSGFLLCGGLTWHFKGNFWEVALVVFVVPLVTYYLFKHIFYVPLPQGIISYL